MYILDTIAFNFTDQLRKLHEKIHAHLNLYYKLKQYAQNNFY